MTQPATSPIHTPYAGPLPISLEDYLAGNSRRHIRVHRYTPLEPQENGEQRYVAFVYSEEGWALSSHRVAGDTHQKCVNALYKRGDLLHVTPRLNEDKTRFV
ncbi:hypothetical protein GO986_16435 [Deinococcus sp. HMF7620]|uniref:Uncharacterized protein n=1 Tax=Deinococcus arboris TaxID=2682977 RepID=A0A7C9HT55_9DEIO|nr:hypothetical protein [Deinococcus arboris]MVN88334.1 hypothetical protein [Deinococcus arboris]